MGKYDKYFMTDVKLPASRQKTADQNVGVYEPVAWLDSNKIKGAFFTECLWCYKPQKDFVPPHTHDFDEVIGFFGSDPSNVRDLGGEVELWVAGEKHIITKSCLIFIPRGVEHCPQSINMVDRPIFNFIVGTGKKYISSAERVE
jgi:hypothetical protein